jgi:hypothetical protein
VLFRSRPGHRGVHERRERDRHPQVLADDRRLRAAAPAAHEPGKFRYPVGVERGDRRRGEVEEVQLLPLHDLFGDVVVREVPRERDQGLDEIGH